MRLCRCLALSLIHIFGFLGLGRLGLGIRRLGRQRFGGDGRLVGAKIGCDFILPYDRVREGFIGGGLFDHLFDFKFLRIGSGRFGLRCRVGRGFAGFLELILFDQVVFRRFGNEGFRSCFNRAFGCGLGVLREEVQLEEVPLFDGVGGVAGELPGSCLLYTSRCV